MLFNGSIVVIERKGFEKKAGTKGKLLYRKGVGENPIYKKWREKMGKKKLHSFFKTLNTSGNSRGTSRFHLLYSSLFPYFLSCASSSGGMPLPYASRE